MTSCTSCGAAWGERCRDGCNSERSFDPPAALLNEELLTDRDVAVDMLARGNMRYQIVVSGSGDAKIHVWGKRSTLPPPGTAGIVLAFNADGTFADMRLGS